MNLHNKPTILTILKSFAVALATLGLVNCGTNSNTITVTKTNGFQQSHGPFDKNGNYIENWADNPPARKIAWKPSSPVKLASNPATPAARPAPTAVATTRTAPRSNNATVTRTTPPRTTYTPPRTTTTPPKKVTPPVVAKQSTAKKITPKAKPPIFHTVKKGDTLYDLARKYGTSVADIQKANNIKGSNIAIGKRLIIPRK